MQMESALAASSQWPGTSAASISGMAQSDAPSRAKRQRGACTECRAAKMRCTRKDPNAAAACDRCNRLGRNCIVELSKLGRKKGSVNKFTDLNRALRKAMECQSEFGPSESTTVDVRSAALSVVANLLEGPSTSALPLVEIRPEESRQSNAPVEVNGLQMPSNSLARPGQLSRALSQGAISRMEAGSEVAINKKHLVAAPCQLLTMPNPIISSQQKEPQWSEERSSHLQTGHIAVGGDLFRLTQARQTLMPGPASVPPNLGGPCDNSSYYIDVSDFDDNDSHNLQSMHSQTNEFSSFIENNLPSPLQGYASDSRLSRSIGRRPSTGRESPSLTARFGDPLSLLSAACHSRSSSVPLSNQEPTPYRIAITATDLGFGVLDTLLYGSKDNLSNLAPTEDLRARTKLYFSTVDVNKLEAGNPDYDPVSIGLLTRQEAESLLDYFYANLASMTLALDPLICTFSYLRNTSPFLLTAVCMVAARFDSSSNHAIVQRLTSHYNLLLREIREHGFRSASIIHGLLLGSGWTEPAQRVSEEVTWSIYCLAVCLGTQLGLHTTFSNNTIGSSAVYAPSQVEMDFCPELSGAFERQARLRRHGERGWLHLFIWATGAARTMNRPWLTPFSDFTPEKVRVWHLSLHALAEDLQTIAIFELRRILHTEILPKVTAQPGAADQNIADFPSLKIYIDRIWEDWHITWYGTTAATSTYSRTPLYQPYPALLWKHHRLLSYSTLLEGCSGVNLVQAATCCLNAALEVVRYMLKELNDGAQLRSMVNNVALMSLYSALCVVKCVFIVGPVERSARSCIVGLLEALANSLIATECNPDAPLKTINFCGHYLNALLGSHVTELLRDEAAGGHVDYELPDPPRHFYDEYMSMYLDCLSYSGLNAGSNGGIDPFFDNYEA